MKPEIPAGMVEVTWDEFYSRLKADPRDIMPTVNNPLYTSWEDTRTREVWGWSYPGWKNAGEEKIFAVAQK